MFRKKKPWYTFSKSYPDRRKQIAWREAVLEIASLSNEELPYQGGELDLPGQNTFTCLSPRCEEPTYDKFCSLCKAEHRAWNYLLTEDKDKF